MTENEAVINGVDESLLTLHTRIANAVFPEDVFGRKLMVFASDTGEEHEAENYEESIEALELELREWLKKCNVKNFLGKNSHFFSAEAEQMLMRLYFEAKERIRESEYGQDLSSEFQVTVNGAKIELRKFVTEEKNFEIYFGNYLNGNRYGRKVIAKISTSSDKNRFLENEIRLMRFLTQKDSPQSKHLSFLDNTFKLADGRLASVADCRVDYYSLEEVRNSLRWQKGIPEKHMVWILNRALSGIGNAHSSDIIHRNLNPMNVLIRPRDHNLVFANWDYALANASSAIANDYPEPSDFLAPEIKSSDKAHLSSDLYSIGKLMIYVLGGDPKTNEIPNSVNPKIRNFLKAFVLESKWQRIGDAWQIHGELIKLIEELWGERKFLKFSMFDI